MNFSNLLGLTIPEGKVVVKPETCTATFVKTMLGNEGMYGWIAYFDADANLQYVKLPDDRNVDSITINVLKNSMVISVDGMLNDIFSSDSENTILVTSDAVSSYYSYAVVITGDTTIEY